MPKKGGGSTNIGFGGSGYTSTTGGKKVLPPPPAKPKPITSSRQRYMAVPDTRNGGKRVIPMRAQVPVSTSTSASPPPPPYSSTAPPPASAVTPPASAAAPPAAPANLADLEAALAALEAKYGLTREQLLADQTAAGDQFRYVLTMLNRSRQDALRGSTNQALGRGVLRSGIYLQDQSRISNEFAQQRAAEEAQNAARLRAIQEALSQLELQLQQDQVATAQEQGFESLEEAQRAAQTY